MPGSQDPATEAELCLRTIEAADNSMFRYLSFFAAIHAAAFAAVASDTVGLSAYLEEIGTDNPEPVVLLLPGLALFMAGLCYVTARGLSDAAMTHSDAVERGQNLEEGLGEFFEDVHSRGEDGSAPSRTRLLRGRRHVLSRHHRAGAAAAGIGALWSGFFIGLILGFPLDLPEGAGKLLGDSALVAGIALGVISVAAGVVFFLQIVAQEVDVGAWKDGEEDSDAE